MERDELREKAKALRLEGNAHYAKKEFEKAKELYSDAISLLPTPTPLKKPPIPPPPPPTSTTSSPSVTATTTTAETAVAAKEEEESEEEKENRKEVAVLLSNRAACNLAMKRHEEVVEDCTRALTLDPGQAKALWRRADAREALGNAREALEDLKKLEEVDPEIGRSEAVMRSRARLEPRAKAQQEREVAEVMAKLKDLGNMVLGKFGLSTDDFKLEKDPRSGGYSIRFDKGSPRPPGAPPSTDPADRDAPDDSKH